MQTLDTETAVVNLATGATVLTYTVLAELDLADLILEVGDGVNNLAAAAETILTVAITIDGVPLRGVDQTETVQIGRARVRVPVPAFSVVAGEVVVVTLTSDQAGDTAVSVTATLRDAASDHVVSVPRTVAALAINRNGQISRRQASEWTITIEELAEIDPGNVLFFTVKSAYTDADSAAILQVRKPLDGTGDIGLIILNAADPGAPRRAEAAIVYSTYVVDLVTYGRVVITVNASATAEVPAIDQKYKWDAKSVGVDTTELDSGELKVTPAVTLTV